MTSHQVRSSLPDEALRRQAAGRWLARWILIVTAGEAFGFAVPALVGVVAHDAPAFPVLLPLAGAVEGALLGWAQATVLAKRLPELRRGAWVALTALAAVVAYVAASFLTAAADSWLSWHWVARTALFLTIGAVILLSIGVAQWIELRRHLAQAGWWIVTTFVAWLLGLGLFFIVATPLWYEGQDMLSAVAVGVGAGLVMAAAMATVTGVAMSSFLRATEEREEGSR